MQRNRWQAGVACNYDAKAGNFGEFGAKSLVDFCCGRDTQKGWIVAGDKLEEMSVQIKVSRLGDFDFSKFHAAISMGLISDQGVFKIAKSPGRETLLRRRA